ncbi:MAG: YggS family pyridoxal phosphate-dependent enzyme [Gemmatales bacterium]|nr:YggS family pyridoxal phosphate-dependent enzyme [Gemmatales bacterium]MDW8222741.1 YggS family pyridoxal phosphate-dependent enzyme [Gemmatales bacterium]
MDIRETLRRNLEKIEEQITSACEQAGRDRGEVTLVAVTKSVNIEVAAALLELGVSNLGESRPQELWRKAAALPQARWHLVGHLQRNKVARTLPLVVLIHSVDSERLLRALEEEGRERNRVADVLLEFNLSGESSKHGFAAADEPRLPDVLAEVQYVRVRGLMTLAPLGTDHETARPTFARLRELRDRLAIRLLGTPHTLHHLSMGMSGDFRGAILEGATLIRIGTALFTGLPDVSTTELPKSLD